VAHTRINLKLSVKKELPIVKRIFLLLQSIKTMSKHIPEFYEFILESSKRGEVWGISSEQSNWTN